jgi:hypothetical protein
MLPDCQSAAAVWWRRPSTTQIFLDFREFFAIIETTCNIVVLGWFSLFIRFYDFQRAFGLQILYFHDADTHPFLT